MADRPERDALIEGVASAWRPRDAYGRIQSHPAWHDLDESGRIDAYETTLVERLLESTLDARGLSATGRAVLGRIHGGHDG